MVDLFPSVASVIDVLFVFMIPMKVARLPDVLKRNLFVFLPWMAACMEFSVSLVSPVIHQMKRARIMDARLTFPFAMVNQAKLELAASHAETLIRPRILAATLFSQSALLHQMS